MGHITVCGGAKMTAPLSPPPAATNLVITGNSLSVQISWTNPADPTFYNAVLVQKVGSVPQSITDGTEVYRGADQGVVLNNLNPKTEYFYAVFAINKKGGYIRPFPTASYTTPNEFYLYNAGDECIGVTGGWSAFHAADNGGGYDDGGNGGYTFNTDYRGTLEVRAYCGNGYSAYGEIAVSNSQVIDMTDIKTLEFTITKGYAEIKGFSVIGLSKTKQRYSSQMELYRQNATYSFLFDVSNLSGNYYICLSAMASCSSSSKSDSEYGWEIYSIKAIGK